tara:strand:+ start:154 stop:603 length:450 start_codon:yes stop_codon:yes gene_type:complete
MDIQVKGQYIRARYRNSEELQRWLLDLGYTWGFGGAAIKHLEHPWVFTNRDGVLSFGLAGYTGNVKESFMPVANPVQPHPYQPIIDKLLEAKTEGWEQAVSWLGNVSLEKVKLMRKGLRGDRTDLYNAFVWSNTPQRHKFWAKQREGLM